MDKLYAWPFHFLNLRLVFSHKIHFLMNCSSGVVWSLFVMLNLFKLQLTLLKDFFLAKCGRWKIKRSKRIGFEWTLRLGFESTLRLGFEFTPRLGFESTQQSARLLYNLGLNPHIIARIWTHTQRSMFNYLQLEWKSLWDLAAIWNHVTLKSEFSEVQHISRLLIKWGTDKRVFATHSGLSLVK